MQDILLGFLLYAILCIILSKPPKGEGTSMLEGEPGQLINYLEEDMQTYTEVQDSDRFLEYKDLCSITGKKLKEYAREARVKKYGSSTKGELVAALLS